MLEGTELFKTEFQAKGTGDIKILTDLLHSHNPSKMLEGTRYYNNDSDIRRRRIWRYEGGARIADETKANRRVANNWHKMLVDQKVGYLAGYPVRFSADDTGFTRKINRYLGEAFDDALCELIKGAANKGVEWLQIFIDEEGLFRFAVIPAEEVIPIWDTRRQERLEGLIRRYRMEDDRGNPMDSIEWWNADSVKYFLRNASGKIEYLAEEPHFSINGAGYGWGRIPFIPFRNNREMLSDLTFYKGLIDDYDLALSDLCNNLAEIQEVITVLKGYEGSDLKEFADNLRYYKVIKVSGGDGSGVDKLEIAIPIEAKRELLNRLEENIFLFGQGVNFKRDDFGDNPSGVALKFLYSLLDMKASITERKFKVGIRTLLWFFTQYLEMSGQGKYDHNSVSVVFGKRLVANDYESAQIASMSKGTISDRTIIAHHPWVEDVDDEIKNTTA